MPVLKKFFSKLGKGGESDASQAVRQPELKRSNARVFKKQSSGLDVLDAIQLEQDEETSTHTTSKSVPPFLQDSSRTYSFEPGASVENFGAELEAHSKRFQRKLKKQKSNEPPAHATLKPKFGLKINDAKLSDVRAGATSPIDLPTQRSDQDSTEHTNTVYGRYGLVVHPSNLVIASNSGSNESHSLHTETPSSSEASTPSSSRTWATTSSEADPFEDARLTSESWETVSSFAKDSSSSKDMKDLKRRNHLMSSTGVSRVLRANRKQRKHLDNKNLIRILQGRTNDLRPDSGVSLGYVPRSSSQTSIRSHFGGKGKGKERRRDSDDDDDSWYSMPASFSNVEAVDRVLEDLQEQHLLQRREEQETDRVKARKLEEELSREQEEADRLAAEEADHLAAEEAARIAEEEASRRLRDCLACADSKDPFDFPAKAPTAACEHNVNTCSECLQSWMASEFETKGCEGIKCPECPQSLDYNEVRAAASEVTFEAYDKLTTRNALGALDEFAWCLGANCGSGQLNVESNQYMDCVKCGYKQCLRHKVVWHKGETCDQYEYRTSGQKARDEEKATEKMIDTVSKKCPGTNCGWRIQKTDGCEHMTCKKCKHQFCWQCLASQADIRRIGNTAHAKSCKFHSTNLDLAYPFNMH